MSVQSRTWDVNSDKSLEKNVTLTKGPKDSQGLNASNASSASKDSQRLHASKDSQRLNVSKDSKVSKDSEVPRASNASKDTSILSNTPNVSNVSKTSIHREMHRPASKMPASSVELGREMKTNNTPTLSQKAKEFEKIKHVTSTEQTEQSDDDTEDEDEMVDFIEDDASESDKSFTDHASDADSDESECDDDSEGETSHDLQEINNETIEPVIGAIASDLDGILSENIVTGKRRRVAPKRYEDEIFSSAEYKKMMLCDIPQDEMDAALVDCVTEDSDIESVDDAYEDEGCDDQ